MAVSGRAGLFTINKFNPNITDDTHATTRGQKSGALRLEFGKLTLGAAPAGTTDLHASVRVTINTGILGVVMPCTIPAPAINNGAVSGTYLIAASGQFASGFFHFDITATGQFSGSANSMDFSYIVIGY